MIISFGANQHSGPSGSKASCQNHWKNLALIAGKSMTLFDKVSPHCLAQPVLARAGAIFRGARWSVQLNLAGSFGSSGIRLTAGGVGSGIAALFYGWAGAGATLVMEPVLVVASHWQSYGTRSWLAPKSLGFRVITVRPSALAVAPMSASGSLMFLFGSLPSPVWRIAAARRMIASFVWMTLMSAETRAASN